MKRSDWGSDVPISLPRAPRRTEREVPMFGFVFTENGLFHDLSREDHESLSTPTYSPAVNPDREIVYGDE